MRHWTAFEIFNWNFHRSIASTCREWKNIWRYGQKWMSYNESGQVWTVAFDLSTCTMRVEKEILKSPDKNWVYLDTCGRGQKKGIKLRICLCEALWDSNNMACFENISQNSFKNSKYRMIQHIIINFSINIIWSATRCLQNLNCNT